MNRMTRVALGGLISFAAFTSTMTSFAAAKKGISQNLPVYQVSISGATEVPQADPTNGILSGGACAPDVNVFDKGQATVQGPNGPEPNHIVFALQVAPSSNAPDVATIAKDTSVAVEIFGADGKLVETVNVPLNAKPDPNTGNPFFVQCVWLNNPGLAKKFGEQSLPTGTYTYKFRTTFTDPTGAFPGKHVRLWTPSNNTFIIKDSSQS